MRTLNRPEILAPVASLEMALAAIHAGADAIYVGAPGVNARARAAPLDDGEFLELIQLCRLYGVKVYLALNTLLFEEELPELIEKMGRWVSWGMDGWIVQDLGVASIAQALYPEQPLHASTQMTLASAEAIEAVASLGIVRAVLARELSHEQIGSVYRQLQKKKLRVELEAFVHGALCISYSGQCLASESFGGRSANRGQCAQSCRLPYKVIVDGEQWSSNKKSYPISPHDLSAVDLLRELQKAGVVSLKIEGRLKSANYVAATVWAYHQQLETGRIEPKERSRMARLFSRGFGFGWLMGTDHHQLVLGVDNSHVGELLGQVIEVKSDRVLIEKGAEVRPGSGILLLSPDRVLRWGGPLHAVIDERHGRWLRLDPQSDLRMVHRGWSAFVNSDPAAEKELQRMRDSREERRRVQVEWRAELRCGEALKLAVRPFDSEAWVEVESESPLVPQQKVDGLGWVKEELSKLAEPWQSAAVELLQKGAPFVPRKELRQLKQLALEQLREKRIAPPVRSLVLPQPLDSLRLLTPPRSTAFNEDGPPLHHLLVRSMEQVDALLKLDPEGMVVTVDLSRELFLRRAILKLQSHGVAAGFATSRVFKEGEGSELERLNSLAPHHILVRNLGALQTLKQSDTPLWGDHFLNCANSYSAFWLLQNGLQRLAPSLDVNSEQLFSLFDSPDFPIDRFEYSLFLRVPLFHSEHCLYADHLGVGGTSETCGAPCMCHTLELQDHKGENHTVVVDPLCRNTIYRGRAQSALLLLPPLLRRGLKQFRFEFVDESGAELMERLTILRSITTGKTTPAEGEKRLVELLSGKIDRGQLF